MTFNVASLPNKAGEFLRSAFKNIPLDLSHTKRGGDLTFASPEAGVLLVTPQHHIGDGLILSAGIHGNETAPIEWLDQLASKILSGELTVKLPLLLILGNLDAIKEGTRFCETNMNRLFSSANTGDENGRSRHSNGVEARAAQPDKEHHRARILMNACAAFTSQLSGHFRHYDLHCVIRHSLHTRFAVAPGISSSKEENVACKSLWQMGVSALLLGSPAKTTFSAYTHYQLGGDSFTVELGQARAFGENDAQQLTLLDRYFTQYIANGTPRLSEIEANSINERDTTRFQVRKEVIRHSEDFELCFAADVSNFTRFEPGTILCKDGSTEIRATVGADHIVFPNRLVPVGQRAVLIIGHEEQD